MLKFSINDAPLSKEGSIRLACSAYHVFPIGDLFYCQGKQYHKNG